MSCWQPAVISWMLHALTIWCLIVSPVRCEAKGTTSCHVKCLDLNTLQDFFSQIAVEVLLLQCSPSRLQDDTYGRGRNDKEQQQEQTTPLQRCDNRGYYLPSILSANGLKQDQYLISTCCIYFINRYFMGFILYWDWISGLNRQKYFLPWRTDLLASCTDLITG